MYKRKVNAPFKPPRPISLPPPEKATLFVPETESNPREESNASSARPTLKRQKLPLKRPSKSHAPTTPSETVTARNEAPDAKSPDSKSKYFLVQWRKRTKKKNKSWEGDGYIKVSGSGTVLKTQLPDQTYKYASRSNSTCTDDVFSVGVFEVEVDSETSREQLMGAQTADQELQIPDTELETTRRAEHPFIPVRKSQQPPSSPVMAASTEAGEVEATQEISVSPPLVMASPEGTDSGSVSVDPRLASVLRPHQRDGVSFIYECLLGMRNKGHHGALLADEMGLGKTLMTISVIWTLLKQSPYEAEKSIARKVLICCPVSLIDNWRKEFGKWLDMNRIGVLALNNKKQSAAKEKEAIRNFGKTNVYQVLIINYEKVTACAAELADIDIDFLVCDEGHRLKNSANKVLKVLNNLSVRKRLVVTGTPIQNDLNEYFNIVNFINPGILGSFQDFQKEFLRPISRAREANCYNDEIIAEGRQKSALLIELTKGFTIRRTKSVIESYLPTKTDLLVFCPPTKLQKKLIEYTRSCSYFNSVLNAGSRDVLAMINLFRKICNSPSLLHQDTHYNTLVQTSSCPNEFQPKNLASRQVGAKINVLVPLMLEFASAGEKSVLVSNFTQTLDLLETILQKLNISYARLDGSTPASSREALVTSFNKSDNYKVFLLSSKAGGVGLNLVGASRLVLFDNDWNPSVDIQAMARIHRDGQKKPVFIYRLFTTGCIDEKVFQRQLVKNSLSDMFLDDQVDSASDVFDYEDLRNLFAVIETNCDTHDLLGCCCSGQGEEVELEEEGSKKPLVLTSSFGSSSSGYRSALEMKDSNESDVATKRGIRNALSRYKHYDPKNGAGIQTGDSILDKLLVRLNDDISYVFVHGSK